ncbi:MULTISPECIES: hypothetical protein [unclassified Rhodococcus (in: high G+C Gram-positive bacteria)]|uniref:hypothetical protein n=1 Tax=unclassified Rhodococcus (in: high G+C Gram-positive bacteria) TaxID=192944 RepID=UPI0015960405|nr:MULTISPECIES: hypothetical protein [unclassified Rhodococcus (in: high G+C Gram-positive bacteria)]
MIDAVHADTPRRRASVVYVPGSRNLYNSETEIHYYGQGQQELVQRMWEPYRRVSPSAE